MKKITVLLAEDHAMARKGFRKTLELEDGLQVVGEARDGRRAVALVKKLRPAVVLMDIALPPLNGMETARQILDAVPTAKVILISAHGDDSHVKSAIKSGAMGFLLKQITPRDLCRAILETHKGGTFFSPFPTGRLHTSRPPSPNRQEQLHKKIARLTPRELEVLQLIAQGMANKETASELGVGVKTVGKHREHLMNKLDIHDTAGLTRCAIGAGIVKSGIQ